MKRYTSNDDIDSHHSPYEGRQQVIRYKPGSNPFLWISPTCLGISATHFGLTSQLTHFIPPPSCLPLLHIRYDASLLLWRL